MIEIKVKPAVMARCKGKTTKEPGGLNGTGVFYGSGSNDPAAMTHQGIHKPQIRRHGLPLRESDEKGGGARVTRKGERE
ncbi:hypothetical protein DWB84_06255 [Saccharophagus sp. K07]|nr:hypothetical protein [Saccharophagus sp. K07]